MKARCHGSSIIFLVNDRGETLSSFHDISNEVVQYFTSLFREDSQGSYVEEAQVLSCIPSLVSREMMDHLMGDIFLEELEGTMFQMKKSKAPSYDGFLIEFFQEFWEIIKLDLLAVVQESQRNK